MSLQQKVKGLQTSASREPLSVERRKLLLNKLRDTVAREEALIKDGLDKDLKKSSFETQSSEMIILLDEIGHILKEIDSLVAPSKVNTPITMAPGSSWVYKEAYGVVLIMAPWNYPFQLAMTPLVGAIAAGNRVVIKPSELAPATAVVLEKIVSQVFNPDEVVVIPGGISETQELLKEKFDYIFFTGSTKVGKIVMRAAAEHLTPLTLELGGKSPCLIDEGVDLVQTARRVAWGKWMNAGQTCVAPDYVLVPQKMRDEFIKELKDALTKFYGQDPKASPDFARIINPSHFERLKGLMAKGTVAIGGETDAATKYIAPTVITDVGWEDPIMQDEIFGPVLPIMTYTHFEDAVSAIKARPKPLAFYFFTKDSAKEKSVIARVPFGGGCINDTIMHLVNGHLPFGGVGESGMGNYHGHHSFATFTHHKAVFKQATLFDIPVRYPPYAGKEKLLKMLMR